MSAQIPHDAVHTPERPPHLNPNNFPSAQADGPANEPEGWLDAAVNIRTAMLGSLTLGDTGHYPPSLDTESTLTADIPINDLLMETENQRLFENNINTLAYIIGHPSNESELPALTAQALQALDYNNSNQSFKDINSWCKDINVFSRDAGKFHLSDSLLMSSRARSRATDSSDVTSSSWSAVSTKSYLDHIGERVCGAGGCFHDITAPTFIVDDDGDITL